MRRINNKFIKTKHFIKRQKERNIDEHFLIEVLEPIQITVERREILVLAAGDYRTRSISAFRLVIEGSFLITVYPHNYMNFTFSKIMLSQHLIFY